MFTSYNLLNNKITEEKFLWWKNTKLRWKICRKSKNSIGKAKGYWEIFHAILSQSINHKFQIGIWLGHNFHFKLSFFFLVTLQSKLNVYSNLEY